MSFTSFTRPVLFAVLVVYLFLVTVFLSSVGTSYNSAQIGLEHTSFFINLVTGISILPVWLNVVFILIPSGMVALIVYSFFAPTINIGG